MLKAFNERFGEYNGTVERWDIIGVDIGEADFGIETSSLNL